MTDSDHTQGETELSKILYAYMRQVEDEYRRRLSISWFARHFKIKQNSLSLYLLGQAEPSDDNLKKIAEKVGLAVYDALGRPRPMPDDPALRFVVSAWEKLNDEDQEAILRIANKDDPGTEMQTKPSAGQL